MTWKAQLKVTGKTFTKPKIKLEPEEEEDTNCKEALKRIFRFWDNYRQDWLRTKHMSRYDIEKQFQLREYLDDVPEEICCKFIEEVNKSFQNNMSYNKLEAEWRFWLNTPANGVNFKIYDRQGGQNPRQGVGIQIFSLNILVFANDMESEIGRKNQIGDIKAVMKRQFKEAL